MEILNQNYSRPRRTKSDDKDKDKDKEKNQGKRDVEIQLHAQTANTWCFKCGRSLCKRDHTCTHKDKPPQEWAANKAMAIALRSFAQAQAQAQEEASATSSITASQVSTATENTNSNEDLPGWMNHLQILQFAKVPIEFKDCILLDTQSGSSLFL